MTHEELKKCIGEYKELKKDLWLTSCWGAKKIEGYDFGVYYNEFAGHWQFCWKDTENEYRVIDIKYIFDNQEDAEWEEEFGDITRTERLKLPTWNEIKNDFNNINKFGTYSVIEFDGYYMDIFVDNYATKSIIATAQPRMPLTKENYMLACRKAKELFLGEKE